MIIKLYNFPRHSEKCILLQTYLSCNAIIKNPIKRQLNDHFLRLFKYDIFLSVVAGGTQKKARIVME